jgi:hypothetical protein
MTNQMTKARLLDEMQAKQTEFETLLVSLNEKQMTRAGVNFDPHRLAWLEGTALWQVVAGNTYEHIAEHMPDIQKWLEQMM